MLYHRGITGVLLAAHGESGGVLSEIDWSRMSAVQIGCLPQAHGLHRVIDDHCGMVRLAMHRILACGYERVGLVVGQGWGDSPDEACSAGFIVEQSCLSAKNRLPIFRRPRVDPDRASGPTSRQWTGELAALAKWYQAYRPEVVIGSSPSVLNSMTQMGLVIPRDVAYVDLRLDLIDFSVAGVRQNCEMAGEVATSVLVGQLQHNMCGTPVVGTSTMVDATWIDGATLPAFKAPAQGLEGLGAGGNLIESASLATA
jgi:LacI family transcriptional regulator